MATTAPMFLELDQEERERDIEQVEEQPEGQQNNIDTRNTDKFMREIQEIQREGKRALLEAEKGNILNLIRIVHEQPAVINFADQDGYTPLHRASYGGHIDCAKYLVRHGANIDARTNDGWTPLHCAARWNNLEVAEFLVRSGADINAKSSGDNTPLHIAASNGRYSLTCDIIQLLLFHPNCNCEIKNQSGDTPFDIAKRSGPFYKLWVGIRTLFDSCLSDVSGLR